MVARDTSTLKRAAHIPTAPSERHHDPREYCARFALVPAEH